MHISAQGGHVEYVTYVRVSSQEANVCSLRGWQPSCKLRKEDYGSDLDEFPRVGYGSVMIPMTCKKNHVVQGTTTMFPLACRPRASPSCPKSTSSAPRLPLRLSRADSPCAHANRSSDVCRAAQDGFHMLTTERHLRSSVKIFVRCCYVALLSRSSGLQ